MPNFLLHEDVDYRLARFRGVPSPYPLTSFVCFAPLAWMPWRMAIWLWTTINLAAVVAILLAAASIAQIRLAEKRGLFFLAMCVGLAPLHTGIATANPSIVGIALSVVGLWLAEHCRDEWAGVLMGLSICIKPPIGLCFLFFYFISHRWKVVIVGSCVVACISLVAIGRLWPSVGVSWLSSYQQLTQQMFSPGSINDFTTANPVWFQMVNLQGPLYAMMGSARVANILALCIGTMLFISWSRRNIARRDRSTTLLAMSALIVLSLVPMYHRFYDSSVSVLPLAWAFSRIGRSRSRTPHLTLLLAVPFLVPGAVLLDQISEGFGLAQENLSGRYLDAFVIGHEAWFLLFLSVALLYAMRFDHGSIDQTDTMLGNDRSAVARSR